MKKNSAIALRCTAKQKAYFQSLAKYYNKTLTELLVDSVEEYDTNRYIEARNAFLNRAAAFLPVPEASSGGATELAQIRALVRGLQHAVPADHSYKQIKRWVDPTRTSDAKFAEIVAMNVAVFLAEMNVEEETVHA